MCVGFIDVNIEKLVETKTFNIIARILALTIHLKE